MRVGARHLCTLSFLILAACGGDDEEAERAAAAAAERVDPAQARQVIEQGTARFAQLLNQGDAAAASEIYAEDARLMPPNTDMIEGREQIQMFWQGAVEQLRLRDVRLETVDIEVEDEQAYEVGTYQITIQPPGEEEPFTDRGKYLVVWQRGDDRTWRWAADIWNTSLPPAEALDVEQPEAEGGTASGAAQGLLGRPAQ